jgi:DNA (cytosine-5)-methyltransferase 3A
MQPMGLFGYPESIIQQPKDRGILLKDILESQVDEKYFLSKRMINSFKIKTQHFKDNGGGFCFKPSDGNNKGRTLTNPGKNRMDDNFIVHNTMPRSGNPKQGGTGHLSRNDGKPYCLDTGNTNAIEIVAMRGRGEKGNIEQQLETNGTNKSNSLTTVTKDNLVAIMLGRSKEWGAPENDKGKSYTLCKEQPHGIKYNSRIRRLTPIECERLQTVEDNYTSVVSDSQRYKMLGNGWTISVIAHIFSYIK